MTRSLGPRTRESALADAVAEKNQSHSRRRGGGAQIRLHRDHPASVEAVGCC